MKKLALAAILGIFAVSVEAQPYATWNRYRFITVNTASTGGGANVPAAVNNFPLLVRLTPTSLATGANVLSEALAGGADIRFTDSSGNTALPYQIDNWSTAEATIWVKVPTVNANGNTVIRIWWNKAGALDSSRGASVFDTLNGFTGAWHLNQDSAGTGAILDATGNALNFNGHASVRAVSGMIGRARNYNATDDPAAFWVDNFTGTENAAKAEKFRATGTAKSPLTISTWVNPLANSGQDIQGIFGHYRHAATARSYHLSLSGVNPGALRIHTSTLGSNDRPVETTTTPLDSLGKWRHVMMTLDSSGEANSQIKVYVDGVRQPMANHATQVIFRAPVANNNQRPMIGAMETAYAHKFTGYIDEIQFSNGVARDSNWARLSYQTQKQAATAVTFGPTATPVSRVLFYPLKLASYKRGATILNNEPVVQGTVASGTPYALTNLAGAAATLPTGLTFSTSTGIIAGAPTVVTATAQYVVTVTLQGGGTGKDTLSVTVIPGDAPGVPGTPTAVVGALGAGIDTVKWTAPANTGSSAITSYKVTAVQDTSKSCTWTSGPLQCAVSGLGSGSFSFQVRAINSDGASERSPASNLVVPPTAPLAPPAISAVVAFNGAADIFWNAPNNGGSVITSYKVINVQDTSKSCTTTGALTCRITGLSTTGTVTFQARATNAVGPGPLSVASAPISVPINPGAFVVRMSGSAKPFSFVLPSTEGVDAMTMVVNDVWGRSVWSKTVVPAKHGRELTWNGKTSAGRAVSAGMYIVKVSVVRGGKSVDFTEKAISLKP